MVQGEVRRLVVPATDVHAAVTFYERSFGFETKFVDGERYASLQAGPISLDVAGPEEDVAGGRPALAIKVGDVSAALDAAVLAGGRVETPPFRGPHEIRAVITDPVGNAIVLYSPA